MRKRISAMVLAVLVSVSAFCMPVIAETVELHSLIPEENLPHGYATTKHKRISNRNAEIGFYDVYLDMYFIVGFNGYVSMTDRSGGYGFVFSDPNSIVMRAYPCNGRDVFTFTEGQTIEIQMTGDKLLEIIPNLENYVEGYGTYRWRDHSYWIRGEYEGTDGKIHWINIGTVNRHTDEFSYMIPAYEVQLPDLGLSLTIDDMTAQHLDYYVVQSQTSGITTSVDWEYQWLTVGGQLRYGNNIDFRGVLVSVYMSNWDASSSPVRFDNGAYLIGNTHDDVLFLFRAEMMAYTTKGLSVSLLNRYLTHFGYEAVYYSSSGSQLSSDIADAGGVIGGYGDSAGAYEDYAAGNVTDLTMAIASAQPIFTGVWNVLPSWFWMLLGVSLTIVIGRKVIGR